MDVIFTRGSHTLAVPAKLHKLNRDRLIEKLKQVDSLKNKKPIVILQGGKDQYRHCTDHSPIFRQESYFHWTFGVEEPDYYGAVEINSGKSYLFAPRLDESYAIWLGKIKTTDQIAAQHGVDFVHYSDEMRQILSNLKPDYLLTLNGVNSDSGSKCQEAVFDGIKEFTINNSILHEIISDLRVFKTPLELDVIRYACKLSSEAHKDVMKKIRPKMKEYQLESMFNHYCYYNGGARLSSYTCICGSGINAATLHYGHSGAPNDGSLEAGNLVLNDMGCEYYCYGSDITCTFPVSGVFTEKQKIIYNAVLAANQAVMKAVKPGICWRDMHLLAERTFLIHLADAGLVKGSIDEMMNSRLGAVFMPHGLGHLLGIDVHDVGGYLSNSPARPTEDGLRSLRTCRTLQSGMVITIEPGVYFIDCALDKAFADPIRSKFLVKEKIDQYRGFGGVRIEDDIVVTESGMELLSPLPRTVEEIESLMAEGRKLKVDFPNSSN